MKQSYKNQSTIASLIFLLFANFSTSFQVLRTYPERNSIEVNEEVVETTSRTNSSRVDKLPTMKPSDYIRTVQNRFSSYWKKHLNVNKSYGNFKNIYSKNNKSSNVLEENRRKQIKLFLQEIALFILKQDKNLQESMRPGNDLSVGRKEQFVSENSNQYHSDETISRESTSMEALAHEFTYKNNNYPANMYRPTLIAIPGGPYSLANYYRASQYPRKPYRTSQLDKRLSGVTTFSYEPRQSLELSTVLWNIVTNIVSYITKSLLFTARKLQYTKLFGQYILGKIAHPHNFYSSGRR